MKSAEDVHRSGQATGAHQDISPFWLGWAVRSMMSTFCVFSFTRSAKAVQGSAQLTVAGVAQYNFRTASKDSMCLSVSRHLCLAPPTPATRVQLIKDLQIDPHQQTKHMFK
eukprot:4465947-Amphidinium_carterae.1